MSVSAHRELARRRYLDAMGITCYLSRGSLPGAAPVQRLMVQRAACPAPLAEPRPAGDNTPSLAGLVQVPPPREPEAPPAANPPGRARPRTQAQAGAQFSLAVLFAADLAWLEDLQGRALATDQVKLVQAMARALSGSADLQGQVQFDWPPHRNRQFDLGPEAASAGLAGFLDRQVEQRHCRGIVLLGGGYTTLVPADRFPALRIVSTASTAEMLADPGLKRRVWGDLQALVQRP